MAILKLDFNFVKNKHNFIEIKVPIRIQNGHIKCMVSKKVIKMGIYHMT